MPKGTVTKPQVVGVRLSAALRRRIEDAAERQQTSMGTIIRQAVAFFLGQSGPKGPITVAGGAAGSVQCTKGVPLTQTE